MDRLSFLFKQYDNISNWYHQAESKAVLVHAINGALVAGLSGLVFVGADKFEKLRVGYGLEIKVLLVLMAICVVFSYMCMLKAVWARHRGREPDLKDKEKLWFFGHLASMQREQYKRLLDSFTEAIIEETMLAQNYILARNVTIKFNALNWAISFTIAAIVMFFVMGVVCVVVASGG